MLAACDDTKQLSPTSTDAARRDARRGRPIPEYRIWQIRAQRGAGEPTADGRCNGAVEIGP